MWRQPHAYRGRVIKAELPLWRALRRPEVLDPLIAAVLTFSAVHALWNPSPIVDYDFRDPDLLGVLLAVVPTLAVAFRGRWPLAVLVVSAVTSLLHAQLGYSQGLGSFAPLLPLYTVAAHRSFRVSGAAALATMALVSVFLATGPLEPGLGDWSSNLFVVATTWAIGRSVRSRRTSQHHLEQRNLALLEARDAETQRLVVEERARIARELQDLVAHHLTEVGVQVAAARRMVRRDPATAEELLLGAESTGRAALEEMRRAGGVLDTPGAGADLRPQPGLDELDRLVERERAAGTEVVLRTEGHPVHAPAGVGLTAYRFVEEALRHLRDDGASRGEVRVRWEESRLGLVVAGRERSRVRWHDGAGDHADELDGLRSRIALYGGELHVSWHPDGGLRLEASFPLTTKEINA